MLQAASVICIILVWYGNTVVLDIELLQLRFEQEFFEEIA